MTLDIEHLRRWIGRTETLHDTATLAPVSALAATLDRDDAPPVPGDAVPPCWHWLYFLPGVRQSGIGPDGHPLRGGFLPPVPLPRRMWAGSRLVFHAPLRAGQALQRSSRIADVRLKDGRTGPLVFVNVRHEKPLEEKQINAFQKEFFTYLSEVQKQTFNEIYSQYKYTPPTEETFRHRVFRDQLKTEDVENKKQ